MLLPIDQYREDFNHAVKIINSQWEASEITESADLHGNHYLSCSINTNYSFNPTMQDCLAIADYLKVRYHKGFFIKKI